MQNSADTSGNDMPAPMMNGDMQSDPFGGGPPPAEAMLSLGLGCVIYIGIILLIVIGYWKMFSKAGLMGVSAIVPVWNGISLAQTAKLQWWFGLLLLIPIVNVVIWIMICLGIAKAFGRGTGTAIGLVLLAPIFAPILGFGSAQYEGEASGFG